MPWGRGLNAALLGLFGIALSHSLLADDQALWREYGLTRTLTAKQGKLNYTAYRMKDLTGAVAAWEWLRPPGGKPCGFTAFCSQDAARTVVSEDNYLVIFESGALNKTRIESIVNALPDKKDTALPAIVTFLPRQSLVPNSSRYVLGNESLKAFAPELTSVRPGFEEGAEAQVAAYQVENSAPVRLAIFDYATPEMARLHALDFKRLPNTHVKRSSVLVAIVLGQVSGKQADTLLSRIEYEAKITWNDSPPPSPIKPLYQLFLNIIYASAALVLLGTVAGLIYAGMRVYRRRYGTLENEEAMTSLNLTRD